MRMDKKKVLIIGIDGATFDIVGPLVRKGALPNIARLMDSGAHGTLKATMPVLSPVSWTSFSTGVDPGNHGIFDFLVRAEGTYDLTPAVSSRRLVKPVWKVASELGKKAVVLNVPATFPPDEVNGFMISGEPTPFHDERVVSPPGFFKDLSDKFGKDCLVPPMFKHRRVSVEDLVSSVSRWTDVALFAMQKLDWDLFTVVYTASDTVQHFFWKDRDETHPGFKKGNPNEGAIDTVFRKIDDSVGELVKAAGDGVEIVILSDHGFGPLSELVSLNKWLTEKGYLIIDEEKRKKTGGVGTFARVILSKLGVIRELPPPLTLVGVDWSKTRVYFLGVSDAVYVNLKGREPQGIVNAGKEYETLVDEVARELLNMRTPEGHKPIEAVFKGRDLYPNNPAAPDVFIKWARGFGLLKEGAPTGKFIQRLRKWNVNNWSGTHEEDGVLVMSGPSVKKSSSKEAHIIDVAPTVYHLLGIEVPKKLDGRVLKECLSDESLKRLAYADTESRQDSSGGQTSEEDAKLVAERLKSLGYLE